VLQILSQGNIMRKLYAIVIMLVISMGAQAQALKIIVPYPAGGPADILARAVQQELVSQNQEVTIFYRPGADGQIGVAELLTKAGDPSWIMLAAPGNTVVASATSDSYYEKFKTLVPVAPASLTHYVVVANKNTNIKSFEQLRNELGRRPVNTGIPSPTGRLLFETISTSANLNLVSYAGQAPMITNLLGGHIDVAMVTLNATNLQHISTGEFVPLAITGERSQFNIRTLSDYGVDNFVVGWLGFFAAPGIADSARDSLNQRLRAAIDSAGVQTFYKQQYMNTFARQDATAFSDFIRQQYQRYKKATVNK